MRNAKVPKKYAYPGTSPIFYLMMLQFKCLYIYIRIYRGCAIAMLDYQRYSSKVSTEAPKQATNINKQKNNSLCGWLKVSHHESVSASNRVLELSQPMRFYPQNICKL